MSETPLADKKQLNNDSGLLTATYAYSPSLADPPKPEPTQADSIEKILSSSIQRAKQKITMLQGKQREERADSRNERPKEPPERSAVANAMKVLQGRVGELERSLQGHERERNIFLKELDNLTSEKKIILSNLEEANRRVTALEQTHRAAKTELRELTRAHEQLQTERGEWEAKCQSLEMSLRHLENDKLQMSASLSRREKEKSSPSHKELILKVTEVEERERALEGRERTAGEKERAVGEREKKLAERERKFIELDRELKERAKGSEDIRGIKQQLRIAKEQNDRLKKIVSELQNELTAEERRQQQQRQNYDGCLKQINDMEGELRMLRETTKHLTHTEPDLDHQLKDSQNKYEELLHVYRRAEERARRDERDLKAGRDRTRELQDLLAEIIDKVNKLPASTKELKYLTVKAGKTLTHNAERMTTLRTPTKSRSKSINRSASKSLSHRKPQPSQLDHSRDSIHGGNSARTGSNSKGKRKDKKEKEDKREREKDEGSKGKRVVVSQGGWEGLEKEILEMKKEYKRLVRQINESADEATRAKLNAMAFQIQEKSERVTKLKQQARPK